jgi:hypothetical protein
LSRICDFKTSNSRIISYRNSVKSVKWNDNTTDLVNSSLSENLDSLLNCLDTMIQNQNDMNDCVKNFSVLLNDIVLPYCDVRPPLCRLHVSISLRFTSKHG